MKEEIALRIAIVALLLGSPHLVPGAEPVDKPRATPIVTRQRLFSIPFYLNPQARPPQEVLLYVSGNQGRSWSLYQRRRAIDPKFDFQAGEDGEFWFSVRTDQDSLPPTDNAQPEKVVVVDTTEPKLSMTVKVGPSGYLRGQWQAVDPNLDASTFRLQYQLADEDQWRPVTVDLPARKAILPEYKAEVAWTVEQRQGMIRVRADVLDRAGNTAVFEDRIELQPVAQPRDLAEQGLPPTAPSENSMAADNPAPPLPWEAQDTVLGDRPARNALPPVEQDLSNSWQPGSSRVASDMASSSRGGKPPRSEPLPRSAPADFVFRSHGTSNSAAEFSPWSGDPTGPRGTDMVFRSTSAASAAERPELRLRPERQVPMTASSRFNLDYDLVDIAKGDVSRVELWMTADNGQNWSVYGTDSDLESPFEVEVQQEGLYGFRLLIYDREGSVASPPRPGDQADLRVGVDQTRPQAMFRSARFISESGGQVLELTWEAGDAHLTDTPVRLSYATSAQGPWIPLTSDLPNSGRYRWQPNRPLPDQVFLQIEVQDRAGNVTRQQLSDPVATRDIRPQGRIRRFKPLAE